MYYEHFDGECRYCKQVGHRKDECPSLRCDVCNSRDHRRRDCPHRPCAYCKQHGHAKERCPRLQCVHCHMWQHQSRDCPSRAATFTELALQWPDCGGEALSVLPSRAPGTEQEYLRSFRPLVLEEMQEAMSQRRNMSQAKLTVASEPRQSNNERTTTLEARGRLHLPENTPFVDVFATCRVRGRTVNALIRKVADACFKVTTLRGDATGWKRGTSLKIEARTSIVTFRRLFDTTSSVLRSVTSAIGKCLGYGDVISLQDVAAPVDVKRAVLEYGVNRTQAVAVAGVANMLRSARPTLAILQGPPGTGKTTTISSMLSFIMDKLGGHHTVLVTAPSNKAVQVAARKFLESRPTAPMALVGVEQRVPDDLLPIFAPNLRRCAGYFRAQVLESDNCNDKSQRLARREGIADSVSSMATRLRTCIRAASAKLQKLSETIRSGRTVPRASWEALEAALEAEPVENCVVSGSRVVFASQAVAGRPRFRELFESAPPDLVLVDEAGQSTELETLVPLTLQPRACLLVGDVKQLPATVVSDRAKQCKYGRSLIERLQLDNGRVALTLCQQYRMHPEIQVHTLCVCVCVCVCTRTAAPGMRGCWPVWLSMLLQHVVNTCCVFLCGVVQKWPSERLYDNRLTASDSVLARPSFASPVQHPCVVLDVRGRESKCGTSLCNVEESKRVADVCHAMVQDGIRPSDIGVITFYSAQVARLQRDIRHPQVIVSTVDGFQVGCHVHVT